MSNRPTNRSDNTESQQTSLATAGEMQALSSVLQSMGIDPSSVKTYVVHHHSKIAWEDLCWQRTKDPKTMVSPIVIVTAMSSDMDAPAEFDGYKGMARVEFVQPDGQKLYITHAMTYAATGELLPLWAWLKGNELPFAMRFGYIETRRQERHVVRAMPLDIETV